MATISKTTVDSNIRAAIFSTLAVTEHGFAKINDRQVGILVTDDNGHQRYVRVGVIVAEEREDMSASELMQSEIDAYSAKQAEKAAKVAERKAKTERDKAARAAKAKAKAEGE